METLKEKIEKPILKNEIVAKITTVGKVEDNISEAKEYAQKLKEYYSKLVFTEEQKDEAAAERANINKAVKKIADYRKSIVADFKKPIEVFEETAKETEKILKETSEFVDIQVKNFENKEKEVRKENAKEIYENNIEELKEIVPFEKIFNDKWLNKGSWKEDNTSPIIENEIIEIREKIRNGLKAIEELHSEFELELKNAFLQDFDLAKAIYKNTQLQEQKKALNKTVEVKEKIVQEKIVTMLAEEVKEDITDPILTYKLKITGPSTRQKALREFLELNKMTFEKID